MTKTRVPDSFEEAALEIVRSLSAAEAARIVGLSPQDVCGTIQMPTGPAGPPCRPRLSLMPLVSSGLGASALLSNPIAVNWRRGPATISGPSATWLVEALDLPGAVGPSAGSHPPQPIERQKAASPFRHPKATPS